MRERQERERECAYTQHVKYMCRCPRKPQGGIRSSNTGAAGSCEPPGMGAENHTLSLWMSTKCSEPLNLHLFFLNVFSDRLSRGSGWPLTHYVAKDDPGLIYDPPSCTSQTLGLRACTNSPGRALYIVFPTHKDKQSEDPQGHTVNRHPETQRSCVNLPLSVHMLSTTYASNGSSKCQTEATGNTVLKQTMKCLRRDCAPT